MDESPAVGMRANRVPVVRALLVAAALTGLFAKHGLGDHGTHDADMAPDHGLMVMAGAAMAGPATAQPSVAHHLDGDRGTMAMGLCLAVLLALVAFAGRPGRAALRLALHAGRRTGSRCGLLYRQRDPPDLALLSICRC
jgi:hypothetical protein